MGLYGVLVSIVTFYYRLARPVLALSAAKRARTALLELFGLAARRMWPLEYVVSSLGWGHASCVKSVAVIGEHVYTGCWDFLVKKWDTQSGACVHTFVGHQQDIIGIAPSPSGRFIFSCGDLCRMWDVDTGEEVARFGQGTYYCAVASARCVYTAKANGLIEEFEYALADGAPGASGAMVAATRSFAGHLAGVMDFDLRGDLLVSASIDMTARAWSISSGSVLQSFSGHRDALRCCSLWRDSLFTGGLDRTIRQWSLASGECMLVVQRHTAAVRALLTVGDSLFSASSDKTILEWDLAPAAELEPLRVLREHTDGVFALCEAGGYLYSGAADRRCLRWSMRTGEVTQEYTSRMPIEGPALLLELFLRQPLRELLPSSFKPIRWAHAFWRDVESAAAMPMIS